jgi:predicted dehydrogenase
LENTVHAIDNLRSMMGNVMRIYSEGGNLFMEHRAPQIDAAVFTLRFENGGIATVAAGYGSEWGFNQEVFAVSSPKMAAEVHGGFDNPTDLRYIYRDNPSDVKTMRFDDASGFSGEFKHIVECIREDKTPIPNGIEGREAVRVCLAVKQSARSGQAVSI